MIIDKTYIINLEHRTDRKEKMIQELNNVGISNYEFFKAYKLTQEDIVKWNPNFLISIPSWFLNTKGDFNKYKIGSLGCLKSHFEIIKTAYDNNYENILILEDDTHFLIQDTFESVLQKMDPQTNKIYNDFGILYLCGNHSTSKITKITQNICYINGTLTTSSYIINKRAMKLIIEQLNHYDREVDVFYSNILQNQIPCYCFIPHFTTQSSDYSDILHKNVYYNLSETIH